MPVVPRIHVVGSSPRSGTTLMFELLVSCFDIDRFGTHEISLFEHPMPSPRRPYASKQPTDFIHVCRLLRWDPALHVIYMQRDPRDVIVSQHGGYPGRYWCDFDIWRRNQVLLPRLAGQPRAFPDLPEYLIKAGHAADRSWLSALAGVTPNLAESVRSELNPLRGKSWPEKAVLRVRRRLSTLRQELRYIAGAFLRR